MPENLFGGIHLLGSDFGRTDFSRIFIFEPSDFPRILSPDFLSSFLWEKVPRKILQEKNPPGKSPAKSSKIYTTKIPDTFLQRGRANIWAYFREAAPKKKCLGNLGIGP